MFRMAPARALASSTGRRGYLASDVAAGIASSSGDRVHATHALLRDWQLAGGRRIGWARHTARSRLLRAARSPVPLSLGAGAALCAAQRVSTGTVCFTSSQASLTKGPYRDRQPVVDRPAITPGCVRAPARAFCAQLARSLATRIGERSSALAREGDSSPAKSRSGQLTRERRFPSVPDTSGSTLLSGKSRSGASPGRRRPPRLAPAETRRRSCSCSAGKAARCLQCWDRRCRAEKTARLQGVTHIRPIRLTHR